MEATRKQWAAICFMTWILLSCLYLRGLFFRDQHELNINRTRPRIACMLISFADNWATQVKAAESTWMPQCYLPKFYYSMKIGVPPLNGGTPLFAHEGRLHLTQKTIQSFKKTYYSYPNIQWFLKADDDVYIVYRSLENYLKQFNPGKLYYIGRRQWVRENAVLDDMLKRNKSSRGEWRDGVNDINGKLYKHGYNSGGAGYVLSRAAVKLLLKGVNNITLQKQGICKTVGGIEDIDIGVCLAHFGVFPIDTRIDGESERFNAMTALQKLSQVDDIKDVISFHKVSPEEMFKLWKFENLVPQT